MTTGQPTFCSTECAAQHERIVGYLTKSAKELDSPYLRTVFGSSDVSLIARNMWMAIHSAELADMAMMQHMLSAAADTADCPCVKRWFAELLRYAKGKSVRGLSDLRVQRRFMA